MNLILFEAHELSPDGNTLQLPTSDARAEHLIKVLRRAEGDSFDAGLVNGPRGKATLLRHDVSAKKLVLSFLPEPPSPTLPASSSHPVSLIVGLPRPQTARKILFEATTIGVDAIHFVATEKSDPNYASSILWSSGEWRRHLVDAAQQAFDTRLPAVTWDRTLQQSLVDLSSGQLRVALDNYEATTSLRSVAGKLQPAAIAIGPERGWGAQDRLALREAGFTLTHLGTRVLRVETAVVAALALVSSP